MKLINSPVPVSFIESGVLLLKNLSVIYTPYFLESLLYGLFLCFRIEVMRGNSTGQFYGNIIYLYISTSHNKIYVFSLKYYNTVHANIYFTYK